MPAFVPQLEDAAFRHHSVDSPIGELQLVGDGRALTELRLRPGPVQGQRDPLCFKEAEEQLRGYFAGELTTFELPLAPRGTDFQLRVWEALLDIPYGETTSYGALAAELGRPDAFRAVGACNGSNPIALIVPCHRVIGADGTLVGYGGGLDRKRKLLELEAAHAAPRLWAGA